MTLPFRPNLASTIRITGNTAGSPVSIGSIMPHGSGCSVRVRNRGSVEAYVEFGNTAGIVASVPGATPGSLGIAPGTSQVLWVNQRERLVAVTSEAGTPSIEITTGEGH